VERTHITRRCPPALDSILAVAVEAAALYALAQARQYAIVCFAHVTNLMAQQGDDFEKGRIRATMPRCR